MSIKYPPVVFTPVVPPIIAVIQEPPIVLSKPINGEVITYEEPNLVNNPVTGLITSVSNIDGTLTILPTSGAVVASLAKTPWNLGAGYPFVTVTPNGPTDGGDYGPNTSGTTTSGINEAWLSGARTIYVKSGGSAYTYNISSMIQGGTDVCFIFDPDVTLKWTGIDGTVGQYKAMFNNSAIIKWIWIGNGMTIDMNSMVYVLAWAVGIQTPFGTSNFSGYPVTSAYVRNLNVINHDGGSIIMQNNSNTNIDVKGLKMSRIALPINNIDMSEVEGINVKWDAEYDLNNCSIFSSSLTSALLHHASLRAIIFNHPSSQTNSGDLALESFTNGYTQPAFTDVDLYTNGIFYTSNGDVASGTVVSNGVRFHGLNADHIQLGTDGGHTEAGGGEIWGNCTEDGQFLHILSSSFFNSYKGLVLGGQHDFAGALSTGATAAILLTGDVPNDQPCDELLIRNDFVVKNFSGPDFIITDGYNSSSAPNNYVAHINIQGGDISINNTIGVAYIKVGSPTVFHVDRKLIGYPLSGSNVAIGAGLTTINIGLPSDFPNNTYRVIVTTNWTTVAYVAAKATSYFTLNFTVAAISGATIDWEISE